MTKSDRAELIKALLIWFENQDISDGDAVTAMAYVLGIHLRDVNSPSKVLEAVVRLALITNEQLRRGDRPETGDLKQGD